MIKNKFAVLIAVIIFIQDVQALQFDVVGACHSGSVFSTAVKIPDEKKISLGDLTVKMFVENEIPFRGSAQGISQIYDSPVGDQALEVLSSAQMRAYGWCVHVDDNEPSEMPDQVIITSIVKKVTWFYAYSFYDEGVWKDYCTASWKEHSLAYCKKR